MALPTMQSPATVVTGSSPQTQSNTVTSGSNLLLVAIVAVNAGTCSSVTFGGVALTRIDGQNSGGNEISVWTMNHAALTANGLVGSAQNLVATGTGGSGGVNLQGLIFKDASDTLGTMVKTSGTGTAYNISIPNTTDDRVFDVSTGPASGFGGSTSTGVTQLYSSNVGGARLRSYYKNGTGSNDVRSWSWQLSHDYNAVGWTVAGGTQAAASTGSHPELAML